MDIHGLSKIKTFAKPKRQTKTTTNETTKQIINYIDAQGWASRINIVAIQRNGKYTSSNMKLGIPDIIGVINGYFVAIEVKTGKDRISENQTKCHKNITERGKGVVFIVSDFNDFLKQFEVWKTKTKL